MKKILTNKKGFTLIELLAVIVVLAIIMVIATQQVNGKIKKSRGNSFYATVQSIRKNMQTVCATDNKITADTLKAATDASDVTFTLSETGKKVEDDIYGTLTITATENGKFTNVVFPKINAKIYKAGNTDMSEGATVTTPEISFYTECPTIPKKVCPESTPNCTDDQKIEDKSPENFEGTE